MNLLSILKLQKEQRRTVPNPVPNVHERIVKAESEAELKYKIKGLNMKGWVMPAKGKLYKQDGVYYTKMFKRFPMGK